MCGFEVAGIVLGSLPLLISAIEHYESNLDRVRAFWKWEDELAKATRELWIQHSSYELTLRNLLRDVASLEEIDEMMADFRHELWRSPALVEDLKAKLHVAYGVYVHIVREMESYMVKLASHLDIVRQTGTSNELEAILLANPPTPQSAHGRLKYNFHRGLKLTMKRKGIQALLRDIKSCNERLDQFIAKANKLDQPTSHSQPTKWKATLTTSLQRIQEYAISLHQALSRVWSCSAQDPHRVYLLLEHRMVRGRKEQRFLRGKEQPSLRGKEQPSLRGKEQPPLRGKEEGWPAASTFTVSLRGPSQNAGQHCMEVKWMMEDVPSTTCTRSRVTFQDPSSQPEASTSTLEPVTNLCPIYCTQPSPIPVPTLGFNLYPRGRLYGTYQPLRQPICPSRDLVSLQDILSKSTRRPLSDEDRYLLAVTLASSLLQLHTTPWLDGCWFKRDILFSETPEGVDVKHPIILNAYGCPVRQSAGQSLPDQFADLMKDSTSLLTLAKVLLEIKLNDRFETQRSEADLGTDARPNEATDIQTLLRWMTAEKGNLSCSYQNAVSHCIKCSVDPTTNLGDLAFRQTLIDKVAVPLLEELHYWQGGIE